ncbi:MAG: hypothetical protein JWM99_649 [Verrucomicrobiales bacterium]|nr:hypothetical protein [Verrucomicrobiales bacterium]
MRIFNEDGFADALSVPQVYVSRIVKRRGASLPAALHIAKLSHPLFVFKVPCNLRGATPRGGTA